MASTRVTRALERQGLLIRDDTFDDERPRFHRSSAPTQPELQRLLRTIARPALSNERLSVNDRGQVVYRLKHPFHDATTHVVLDPMEFMRHIRVPHPFGAASGCANRQSCRFGIARLAAPEVPLAQRAR